MKLLPAGLLMLTVAATPLFADIDSFTDSVQDANADAVEQDKEKEDARYSRSYSSSSDPLGDALFEIICGVWFINNFTVTFEQYPYADDGKYLHFDSLLNDGSSTLFSDTWHDRPFRYTVATSAVYTNGIGFGDESCFEGYLFKFFGPLLENTVYTDFQNMTGNVKLGGQMALLQTNPISIIFYCQWTHWYGTVGDTLPESGLSGGFIMRSYPIRPFVAEWKLGWQNFGDEYADFMESDLRFGVMLNSLEVFAGWKYVKVSNNTTFRIYSENNGATLGARLYF